jgi:hypothetical protein
MKNRRNTAVPMLMVAVMVVAAQTPVWGAVLIDNNFDGVADDIGPSFANRSWGDSSNANPNTGVLQLDDRNHYRVGLSTTSTVDASSAPGFTATWVCQFKQRNVCCGHRSRLVFWCVDCYEWQQQSLG